MDKSFVPIIEHSGIINLLNEFNKEAENVIAHLVAIDAACQSETEQARLLGCIRGPVRPGYGH